MRSLVETGFNVFKFLFIAAVSVLPLVLISIYLMPFRLGFWLIELIGKKYE